MTRDETRGEIDLSLPIEGFEQSDTLLFGQNRQEIAERSRDRQAYTPPSRFWIPNSATCRTKSGGGTPAASWPQTALAMTRPRTCPRPSSSRWHQCAAGSA